MEGALEGTDGVWEMMNPTGDVYGKERLKGTIRDHAGNSSQEIVQAICASLEDFRKERRTTDDVTFVVIKVTDLDS